MGRTELWHVFAVARLRDVVTWCGYRNWLYRKGSHDQSFVLLPEIPRELEVCKL